MSLRSDIIRLATENPTLRRDLVPLLRQSKQHRRPGEVWKTPGGWSGMNADKATHTFQDSESASAFAKGTEKKETPRKKPGEKPEKEQAPSKEEGEGQETEKEPAKEGEPGEEPEEEGEKESYLDIIKKFPGRKLQIFKKDVKNIWGDIKKLKDAPDWAKGLLYDDKFRKKALTSAADFVKDLPKSVATEAWHTLKHEYKEWGEAIDGFRHPPPTNEQKKAQLTVGIHVGTACGVALLAHGFALKAVAHASHSLLMNVAKKAAMSAMNKRLGNIPLYTEIIELGDLSFDNIHDYVIGQTEKALEREGVGEGKKASADMSNDEKFDSFFLKFVAISVSEEIRNLSEEDIRNMMAEAVKEQDEEGEQDEDTDQEA